MNTFDTSLISVSLRHDDTEQVHDMDTLTRHSIVYPSAMTSLEREEPDNATDAETPPSPASPEPSDTPVSVPRPRVGSWRPTGPEVRCARLMWRCGALPHVWDVDFTAEGRVLVVAGAEARADGRVISMAHRRLHALSLSGEIEPPPTPPQDTDRPGQWRDPAGVAVCRRTGALAVTERPGVGTQGTVTVVSVGGPPRVHTTHNTAMRLALTPDGVAACAVRWEKLVKYTAGQKSWTKSISSTNDLTPFIAALPSGNLVISTPASSRVSVVSPQGGLVAVFPSWLLRRPTGVCVDGAGHVYVADRASQSVSQFTETGRFLQKIVQLDVEPRAISLLDTSHLAVATNFRGLYLYRIQWDT